MGVYDAINDVVVSRGKLARVIRIEAVIDGEVLQLFAADGAIIATATGSTAYRSRRVVRFWRRRCGRCC